MQMMNTKFSYSLSLKITCFLWVVILLYNGVISIDQTKVEQDIKSCERVGMNKLMLVTIKGEVISATACSSLNDKIRELPEISGEERPENKIFVIYF